MYRPSMNQFDKHLRVAVFNANGSLIYDQAEERTKSMSSAERASYSHSLPADKLWPLIHNFSKFSHDVQGGRVRRLVFRSPKAYASSTHRFEASAHPTQNHQLVTV